LRNAKAEEQNATGSGGDERHASTEVLRSPGHEGLIILISLDFRRFYAKRGKP